MKQIGLLTLVVLVTVVITLAFSAAAGGPRAAAQPVAAAAAVPAAPAVAAMPAPHPHIQAALEAMRHARHELDDAAHDFHGHRVEAIKHLDAAIHEAEVCEQEP